MSRYPLEATAVGLLHHGRQKIYMFSIFWSDQNIILIYRTFEDFKYLTKELKKMFPLEAGLVRKSERVLPILKDVPLLFRSSKVSSRDIERLSLLEMYSKALLQTDAKISQCENVIQFFAPNNQDFNPSFPEKSMMVMPSETQQGQKTETDVKLSQQPITQPLVSQRYMCIETFETKDTKNRPFRVNRNECIDVLIKDNTGWWLVENDEKCLAWFPAPYLDNHEAADKSHETESLKDGTVYFAVKSYKAQSPDELSIAIGVVVDVIEKSNIGWWLIWYNGRAGYVPSMFLKPYKNPHQKLQVPLSQDKFASTPKLYEAVRWLDGNKEENIFEKPGDGKQKDVKNLLDRKLSHSWNDVSDISGPLVRGSIMTHRQRPPRGFVGLKNDEDHKPVPLSKKAEMPIMQELSEDAFNMYKENSMKMIDPTERSLRKDSGFDEPCLYVSKPLNSSHFTDPTPPMLPPRPSKQEILTRCTTVTREAAKMSCLHPSI